MLHSYISFLTKMHVWFDHVKLQFMENINKKIVYSTLLSWLHLTESGSKSIPPCFHQKVHRRACSIINDSTRPPNTELYHFGPRAVGTQVWNAELQGWGKVSIYKQSNSSITLSPPPPTQTHLPLCPLILHYSESVAHSMRQVLFFAQVFHTCITRTVYL